MREKALNRAIKVLKENFPAAEYCDKWSIGVTRAFPKGCLTDLDEFSGITNLYLVQDNDRSNLSLLLDEAETCPKAFDAVCAWVDGHLLNSGTIPCDHTACRAARLVASYRLGVNSRPNSSKRGRKSAGQHEQRYAVLRLAVAEVEAFGFRPCRSPGSSHNNSACDIVGEAMVTLGFLPNAAKTIEGIFNLVTGSIF